VTTPTPALVPRALSRFRFPLIALQWGGNLLALLLAAAWLQIPDSHAWQFALSLFSAALLVTGFCWLQAVSLSHVRSTTQPASIWLRILGVALVAVLWLLLAQWISSGSDAIPDYAYLWNSKLSPGMRVTLSPPRIIAALSFLLSLLIWIVTALLLPVAIALSAQGLIRPTWRDVLRPYRRFPYWVAVVAFCIITTQFTAGLVSWQPGKGVSGEVASILLRLALAYTTDILLWCLLLAFTGAWMEPPAPAPVIEMPAPL
jgi:hypothetical protein